MVNAMSAMPRIIRKSLVGGDAVRATAKNAIAQSGNASVRWNTRAISDLPPLDRVLAGARLERLQ
jgi:hypothetical protein